MKILFYIFLILPLSLFAQLSQDSTKYFLEHNELTFPIDNRGILADVGVDENQSSMRLNGKSILFSGGFYLSGFANDSLWANGQASVYRNEDYLPGSYKYSQYDNAAKLYILKKSDEPFSESWQEWKNAVKLGADFYDGDNDGIYNPIDKNGNGEWDLNEDRPDLLGEQTAWCVFKDSVPSELRLLTNVKPRGIEIQQTVFTSSINESFKSTIFVRYRIENSGLVSDVLDSVYFGAWSDPDLGEYIDDLVGCDTTLNAGFVYQNRPDDDFEQTAPALLVSLLQGPPIYIPDSTFIDINDNGIFDETDRPLTSAYANNGIVKGVNYIEGAINSSIKSFPPFYCPYLHCWFDLSTIYSTRTMMVGLDSLGNQITPCNWDYGTVLDDDCENIDVSYSYSGDPILLSGWLNTNPNDQRMMVSSGPFQLIENKPIDIVVAYVVGYYPSHSLLSLKDAKHKVRTVGLYFLNNAFETIEDVPTNTPAPDFDFGLEQNYPNPFGTAIPNGNPTTKISYTIPSDEEPQNVILKVYNLLGEVVVTLVNKVQTGGSYSVELSAENLSNGVYIYSLSNGRFHQSKKMMVLK